MRIKPLIFLIFILNVIACRYDNLQDYSDCAEFDIQPSVIGPLYGETEIQFKAPFINPNNDSEFVYIFYDKITEMSSLEIYNYSTGEKKVLLENDVWDVSQPNWGINNKIAFNKANQIYWISSEGSDLRQLDNDYRSCYPEWINADSTLVFTNYWLEPGNQYHGDIEHMYETSLSAEGTLIDSFTITYNGGSYGLPLGTYNNTNRLFACIQNLNGNGEFTLDLIDIKNKIIINSVQLPNVENKSICCIQWHPNGQDIFFSQWYGNLYKYNLASNTTSIVLESCDSRWYNKFSLSADGNKMVAEKVNNTFDGLTIWQTSEIVLMNIDGSGEVIILQ
ncbi:MAG: hypothetical protein WAT43_16220 [Chitinophagales bacterium]